MSPPPGSSSLIWPSGRMRILSAVSDRCVDPVRVQPEHRVPHVLQLRVGHRAAPLGQRRAAVGVGGQRHGVRADPQHGPQPRRAAHRRPPPRRSAAPGARPAARWTAGPAGRPGRAAGPAGTAGTARRPPAGPGRTRSRPAARRPGWPPRTAATPRRTPRPGASRSPARRPSQERRRSPRPAAAATGEPATYRTASAMTRPTSRVISTESTEVLQVGQAGHQVDADGQPQRHPPPGPAAQVDDRGEGDQPGQRRVKRGEAARPRRGHRDRPVQRPGRTRGCCAAPGRPAAPGRSCRAPVATASASRRPWRRTSCRMASATGEAPAGRTGRCRGAWAAPRPAAAG